MFKNRSVSVHSFSMIPRADIPRSSFRMQKMLKTSFDSGYLVPIMCEEVLPGDTFNTRMTAFCRLATPIFPFMDNLHLETFFFFVPCRLVWENWKRFMGEQDDPGDSISFVVPQCTMPAGGFAILSVFDYFGLPTVGQITAGLARTVNTLPLRAYNLIYNEWFRDENLIDSATVLRNDGPDPTATYALRRRGKRHDYFTSCLPWPQKGNAPVSLPLGTSAPVVRDGTVYWNTPGPRFESNITPANEGFLTTGGVGANQAVRWSGTAGAAGEFLDWSSNAPGLGLPGTGLMADLSTATAATINQIRQAFQIQRLLERDARGGTRYTEIVRSHFGVISPDARLQRPEYLGGGYTPVNLHPVAQTSETAGTPQGELAAFGTALAGGHGFTQSFTEHGYVIGLANVRADLTYQQGLRKMWTRSTRYDFYFPVFAHLGEQAVSRMEIYITGEGTSDNTVFGYQERWAEYRYNPSQITGLMRSTSAGSIDPWHLAQRFTAAPVLNQAFIEENPPLARVLAADTGANGQQLLMDAFFDIKAARPMPMYSVPGMIDHF